MYGLFRVYASARERGAPPGRCLRRCAPGCALPAPPSRAHPARAERCMQAPTVLPPASWTRSTSPVGSTSEPKFSSYFYDPPCWPLDQVHRARILGPGRSITLLVVVPLIFGRGFILAPGPGPATMHSRCLGGTIGGPGPPPGIKPRPKMAWTWSKQGMVGAIFGGSARGWRPLPRLTAWRHCHLAARPAR